MSRQILVPSLIDTSRARVKYQCPTCHKDHFVAMPYVLADMPQMWDVQCPNGVIFRLKLWLESYRTPSCPTGDIPVIPKPNCPECKGTGEYIGFLKVETCKTCK